MYSFSAPVGAGADFFKLTFQHIGHIIYLTRQLEKIDEAYPLREIQVIKK